MYYLNPFFGKEEEWHNPWDDVKDDDIEYDYPGNNDDDDSEDWETDDGEEPWIGDI